MALHNLSGEAAEGALAKYLEQNGYKVVDRNWKTKGCEIDIIAKKDGVMHFVEVKYRSSDSHGSGFDYVTPAKIRQMSYAANLWVAKERWENEYVLSAAEVSGPNFQIEFLDEIT